MNHKNFTTLLIASLLVGIFTVDGLANSPQKPQKNEDIVLACNTEVTREIRMSAINRIAELNDWQSLSRILLFVTKRHNSAIEQIKKSNPMSIARNENNVLNLGIDEFIILKELSRIGNPGAIPYILEFRRIRSNQGNMRSGEYWAVIDKTTRDLREKMFEWSPKSGTDKENL
ncbi:MAG: hypothetical protein AB8B55_01300 [Mariniblastus sp.]